jgi:excisionase family DNA binding protein
MSVLLVPIIPPEAPMAPKLLTLAQAAELLGRSPETLRKQVQRGSLKAQLVGKTYVVTPAEVERYRLEHLGEHRGGFPAGQKRVSKP